VSPIDKNLDTEVINRIFHCSYHILINKLDAYDPNEENIIKAGLDRPKAKITLYNNDTMIDYIVFGNTFVLNESNTYFRTSQYPMIFITRTQVDADLNSVLEAIFAV
jgi:hypothetical protein